MQPSETTADDSMFRKGVPYSSHHKILAGKAENVIYIPSNEEEFDAEMSRLDYRGKAIDHCDNALCFDNCFTEKGMRYNDLLESFTFSVRSTKQPGLSYKRKFYGARSKEQPNFKCESVANVERKKEIHPKMGVQRNDASGVSSFTEDSGSLICDNSVSELSGTECNDVLVNTGRYSDLMSSSGFTGSDQNHDESLLGNIEDNDNLDHQQSDFVEINLLAIDTINHVNEENTGDLNQVNKGNLRGFVRALIKTIFESPRKNLKCIKQRYEHKQKEVKISVNELFKDDKLDFIVKDRKKVNKCTQLLTSKKILFLQLCFLAILSIYFMSYFNSVHSIKLF